MKAISIKEYETRLLRVLDHIDDHLAEPLDLDGLAAIACFSPYHFHRIFRGMTGEPLARYVRRRRLELALARLGAEETPIITLAMDCGFESAESFSRAFKTRFGVSPRKFRQTGQLPMTRQSLQSALAEKTNSKARALAHFMQRKGREIMFEVEIKSIPAIRFAHQHHTGPYMELGPVFERVMALAGEQGLFGPQTQIMALYYDDPHTVEASALRSDAGLSISEAANVKEPLQVGDIAPGEYAVAILKGPYDGLQAAYDWLYGQWLPQSGREARNVPCLEIYLTDPQTTKPEDYLTEIRIPLT